MTDVTSEHKVTKVHAKLVRDLILGRIEAKGETAECRVMTHDEFVAALTAKLTEEATELDPAAPAGEVVYASCAEVKAAGVAPISAGYPGFSLKFDGNGDGVGCEA